MMYNPETNHSIFVEKQIRVPTFTMAYEHSHSYCEIFYLKTGSCVYYINGNMVNLSAGDFFVVPPLVSHYTRYEGQTPCERILVNCHLDALPESFLRLHEALLKKFFTPCEADSSPKSNSPSGKSSGQPHRREQYPRRLLRRTSDALHP